jgi:hypothetical protein
MVPFMAFIEYSVSLMQYWIFGQFLDRTATKQTTTTRVGVHTGWSIRNSISQGS